MILILPLNFLINHLMLSVVLIRGSSINAMCLLNDIYAYHIFKRRKKKKKNKKKTMENGEYRL